MKLGALVSLGIAFVLLGGCGNPDGQGNHTAPPPPTEEQLSEMPDQARQSAEMAQRYADQERQRTERMGGRQGPSDN